MGSQEVAIEVESVMQLLLRQEDTDNDKRITINDKGPKVKDYVVSFRGFADKRYENSPFGWIL